MIYYICPLVVCGALVLLLLGVHFTKQRYLALMALALFCYFPCLILWAAFVDFFGYLFLEPFYTGNTPLNDAVVCNIFELPPIGFSIILGVLLLGLYYRKGNKSNARSKQT